MDYDTRVGCYAWIEQDGQVLLALAAGWTGSDGRHVRPCWTLPGGGLEAHESCEQATVREVAEESGYAVRLTGLLGTGTAVVATADRLVTAERPLLLVHLVYAAEITGGELVPELDGSTEDVRWVPLEDLPSLPCSRQVDLALDLQRREHREGPLVDEAPVDEETVRRIVDAVPAAPVRGATRIVAIDGPSGSGKTTLAQAVAQDLGCPVVHMDDLYPGWDGLAAAVDLVTDQVLEPLARGERAAYRVWDWALGDWGRTATVPAADLIVLEGCGSSVGRAGEYAALRVWVDADEQVRHRRGIERDGETFAPHWEQWAAQERELFGRDRTAQRAHLTVRT
ncbi:NUDIX domain-containing protein [Ornithinimicrobium cavernae]|uniref:NUDIX domain-containing protein n=1 Tax=Ornithinimicrobium cavernae TaxID=2666047 RepID=UPI000D69B736|nr:NUDIX domain-containing protein [Ornithinimicrobium cavernae]